MNIRNTILLALSMGIGLSMSNVLPALAVNVGDEKTEKVVDKAAGEKDGAKGTWFVTKETTYRYGVKSIIPNSAPAMLSKWAPTAGQMKVDMGGLAVDGAGNVYTTNWSAQKTIRVEPNGKSTVLDIYDPWPSVDSHGNVYLSNGVDGKVYKVDPNGNRTAVYDAGGYVRVVPDANDNLFFLQGGKIFKIDHLTGLKTAVGNNSFSNPSTLNVDQKGNVYLTNWGPYVGENGKVFQIAPDGKSKVVYENTSFQGQVGVGPDGSIYVGDYTDSCIYMIDPETKVKTKVLSGVNPRNMSFDKDGNMYAQTGSGVMKIQLK